jgi:hypothetical protein
MQALAFVDYGPVPLAERAGSGQNRCVVAAPAPRQQRERTLPQQTTRLEKAVVKERAKRRAKTHHDLERKRAGRRFLALMLTLAFVAVVLGLTIWDQIQALFGL